MESRADAHAVMPRNGKHPPYERTQDSLADSERNDVALACEQPAHRGAPNQGERNENGIGPMERREENPCRQCGEPMVPESTKETIHDQRLESDFLEQAEGKVGKKAMGGKCGKSAMESAEKSTGEKERGDEDGEDVEGTPSGGPEIAGTPAEGLGGVAVNEPAGEEPDGKDDPDGRMRDLAAPYVKGDECREEDGFEKIQPGCESRFHGEDRSRSWRTSSDSSPAGESGGEGWKRPLKLRSGRPRRVMAAGSQ